MNPWLTVEEIGALLDLLKQWFGWGYSDVPAVGRLQAKLSILLEVAQRLDRHSEYIETRPVPPEAPAADVRDLAAIAKAEGGDAPDLLRELADHPRRPAPAEAGGMRTIEEMQELLAVLSTVWISDEVRSVASRLMHAGDGDRLWRHIPAADRPLVLRCMCDIAAAVSVTRTLEWVLGEENDLLQMSRDLAKLTSDRDCVIHRAGRALGAFDGGGT